MYLSPTMCVILWSISVLLYRCTCLIGFGFLLTPNVNVTSFSLKCFMFLFLASNSDYLLNISSYHWEQCSTRFLKYTILSFKLPSFLISERKEPVDVLIYGIWRSRNVLFFHECLFLMPINLPSSFVLGWRITRAHQTLIKSWPGQLVQTKM